MHLKSLTAFALFSLISLPILAQTPPTSLTRIKGTVVSLNGQTLTVKGENGQTTAFTVQPDTKVIVNIKSSLADIKTGDFVGSAAVLRADGKLHAKEVHIMPGALRGQGEGHRPMGEPDTSMTNATVTDIEGAATSTDGRTLKMQYQGGTAEIMVGPNVPVMTLQTQELSVLHPGSAVSVTGTKTDAGMQVRFLTLDDGTK